tara:strand:- start:321 stop:1277 length:957 start_codon:yes stop_codon:yes gene_type:complete
MTGRDLLAISDLTTDGLRSILEGAAILKVAHKQNIDHSVLKNKSLAMIFEKPSLRTRTTFEVGMLQLGGHSIDLAQEHLQLGVRESISDIGRNLARWVDIVMARVFEHNTLEKLASSSSIPVINGLSDRSHPCQILADLFTIMETYGDFRDITVAYVGDGYNVANSLIAGCSMLGIPIRLSCPKGYEPSRSVIEHSLKAYPQANIEIMRDPFEAVTGANVVYTDSWISMGLEKDAKSRIKAFTKYQVNKELMSRAENNAIFMHCLPAHRGQEVTDEVIDGPNSAVFEQAENRLHVQKSLLVHTINGADTFKHIAETLR